jgi:competence protein ComEC
MRRRHAPRDPDSAGGRLSAALLHRAATWRLLVATVAAWSAAAVPGNPRHTALLAVVCAILAALALRRRRTRPAAWAASTCLLASLAAGLVAAHLFAMPTGDDHYRGEALIVSDPVQTPGGMHRGSVHTPRGSLEILSRAGLPPAGSRIMLDADLKTAGPRITAFTDNRPATLGPPGAPWRLRAHLRSFLADAAGTGHAGTRLLPGLVIGDTAAVDELLAEQMKIVSLSHVMAVSGANITLITVTAVWVLRHLTRRRGAILAVSTAIGLAYVFIVGPEPSALRAAAMGLAGTLALARKTGRNTPAVLCTALLVLVIVAPQLAVSAGFILSAAATAGLIVLGRPVTDALRRAHLPLPVAAALAVPLCAQIAVLPVLVALGSAPSAWSVVANLLAGPAVAPATILGLGALVCGLGSGVLPGIDWCGRALAQLGALPSWWIAELARIGAELPGAVLPWPAGALGLALAGLITAAFAAACLRRLRLWRWSLPVAAAALVAGLVLPLAPRAQLGHWTVAVCDVGQGSATAVSLGPGRVLLIDAGRDPAAVDSCLRDLRAEHVWVALSHFDADHVQGLSGAVRGRTVEALWISAPLADDDRARRAEAITGRSAQPLRAGAAFSLPGTEVSWRVLWPRPDSTVPAADGRVADGNAESLVFLIMVADRTVLAPGDIGAAQQRRLAGTFGRVDVLIAPHHGSADIDPGFFAGAGPAAGVVSVGENRYGHPTRAALEAFGQVPVLRTDVCGTIVLDVDGGLRGTRGCGG